MKLLILIGCFLFSTAYAQQSFDKIIVGNFEPDWVKVEKIDNEQMREQSKAIGRLIMPAKRNAACTAFLISDDVIMTNHHCISSAADAVGAKVLFNYLSEGEPQVFICDRFISNNEKLDYALLGCEGAPGSIYGKVKLAQNGPSISDPIYLIHQNCDYYQNSRCRRSKIISFGEITNVKNSQVYHNADTLPGSSGSPIFSLKTHEVIGLHNSGSGEEETNGRRNGRGKVNLGIKMSMITSEIGTILPEIL